MDLDETVSIDELSLRSSVADPSYTIEASFVYTAYVRHRQDLCLAKHYGELFMYMLRSGERIDFLSWLFIRTSPALVSPC